MPTLAVQTSPTPRGQHASAVAGDEEIPVHGRAVRQRQRCFDARDFSTRYSAISLGVRSRYSRAIARECAIGLPRESRASCLGLLTFAGNVARIPPGPGVYDVPTSHTPDRYVSCYGFGRRWWIPRRWRPIEVCGDRHANLDGGAIEQRLRVVPLAHRRDCCVRQVGVRLTDDADVGEKPIQRDASLHDHAAACTGAAQIHRIRGSKVP